MEVQDSKWYGLDKSVQSIKQDCLNIDSPVFYIAQGIDLVACWNKRSDGTGKL